MKKLVMLSQPMGGKSENEILDTKRKAITTLIKKDYKVLDTYS